MSSWDLKIHLDPPCDPARFRSHLFGPGEKVSGKVIFSPKSDEDVESIYIEFKGRCKTSHGRGKEEHRYERDMFFLTQNLFKGPYKMRAGTHEYPFSFIFPEKFMYWGNEFRDEGMFRGQAEPGKLPCPPSCEDDGSFNGGLEIQYHLTTRIPRTFMDWEDKVYLNYSPWRTEADVREERKVAKVDQYEEHHTHYRLTGEGVPRALTKTEAFKEMLHHKAETKTVHFSLSATAPTQIVIGKSYPVEITLTSKDAEELGIVPEFKIKSYQLFLKGRANVRVPGAFVDHETYIEGHIPLTNYEKLDVVLPVNKAVKFNGMFPTRGPYPPPTFMSWAIRRTYGLELKATVECLGEEESFKIHWTGVELHPARMEPGVEEAIRSIESGTANLDVGLEERVVEGLPEYQPGHGQEEVLPRYEKHVDGNVLGL